MRSYVPLQLIVNEGFAYTNLVIYGDDVLSPKIDEGINFGEFYINTVRLLHNSF